MVRAAVAVLLCSAHASGDAVLMQTQTQSEHILDALHTGSGRVKKMQENTHAMEEQYKDLLQKIVTSQSMTDPTGRPWLPSSEFFAAVDKQFTDLIDELDNEKTQNQILLTTSHAAVSQCNSDMEKDIKSDVVPKLDTAVSGVWATRKAHAQCRADEDALISDMETECGAFESISTKCSDHQDWYAAYEDSTVEQKQPENAANTLDALIQQADKCKTEVDALAKKAPACDEAQRTFRSSYCLYARQLNTVCNNHAKCFMDKTQSLQATTASVAALEKEQKIIFRMVKRVQCYVTKLRNARSDAMPTQADITYCNTACSVEEAKGRDYCDDSSLSITYAIVATPNDCMPNTVQGQSLQYNTELLGGENAQLDHASFSYKPGAQAWYDAEFNGMKTHDKLESSTGCTGFPSSGWNADWEAKTTLSPPE